MSYAGDRVINDADSHLMELPDFLTAHAQAAVRERLPDLTAALTGQFDPDRYAGRRGHGPDTVARLTALGDGLIRGPKWHDALGAFDGAGAWSARSTCLVFAARWCSRRSVRG